MRIFHYFRERLFSLVRSFYFMEKLNGLNYLKSGNVRHGVYTVPKKINTLTLQLHTLIRELAKCFVGETNLHQHRTAIEKSHIEWNNASAPVQWVEKEDQTEL